MISGYLEELDIWGTKGVYAVSLSAAIRWAFWNSLKTTCKSFASLASAIFLLACIKIFYVLSPSKPKDRSLGSNI